MQNTLILLAAATLCVSGLPSPIAINQHWAQRSVRSAVQTGVEKALAQQIQLPTPIRFQVEDVVVDTVSNHLYTELKSLDSFVEESNKIIQDFVTDSVNAVSTRTRWPNEQIIQFLSAKVAEAEEKISALRVSTGVVPAESRISAVNREEIVANIVSDLMKDPSFVSLIGWLDTLPASIHMIADQFLANKTFEQIFDSIRSRSDQMMAGVVQGLVVEDVADVERSGDNKPTQHSKSAVGLVGAGIQEAQSVLELTEKTYRMLIDQRIQELKNRMTVLHQMAPYIPQEVMDYIEASAIRMMRIKPTNE